MTRILRLPRHIHQALSAPALAAVLATGVALAPAGAQTARLSNGAPASFADLIEEVSPAVVSINVISQAPAGQFGGRDFSFEGAPPEMEEFFEQFRRQFGGPDAEPREARSLGSGFFVREDGYLVTNFHVVDDATEITVTLDGGEEYTAEIVGLDEPTDLAVLKVDRDEPFKAVSFDTDLDVRRGDWVVAVGNPFGLQSTATAGIVSAIGRETNGMFSQYTPFIQVDAAINRGNSGGPTFNLNGEVVGVNSQIYSPTGASVGIGFAIPGDVASRIVERLIADGRVVRGWLGVEIQNLSEELADAMGLDEAKGAIVARVVPDGPAESSGIRAQDIILEVDGVEVADNRELSRRVGDLIAGETVPFRVWRDGRERTIRVAIAERPAEGVLRGEDDERPSASSSTDEGLWGMSLRRMTDADRDRLGLNADETGVVIEDLSFTSEARERGLREGMAILTANGDAVNSAQDLRDAQDAARRQNKSQLALYVRAVNRYLFIPLPLEAEG